MPRYTQSNLYTPSTDLFSEIAKGAVVGYQYNIIFGRNSDIDTSSDPEDIWEGGGIYTGQPNTDVEELITVSSSSAADTAAGTGARTVRIHGLKSTSSTAYETEDLTLNGTSLVDSVNTWYRVNKVEVLTAGSGGANAGILSVAHKTTTANIFAKVAVGYNHSSIAAYTMPAGKKTQLKRLRVSMARANGSPGSATITLRVRPNGGVYKAVRVFEISNTQSVDFTNEGGDIFVQHSDILIRVESVTDNNTVIDAAMELVTEEC